jgi:hypothetical protein
VIDHKADELQLVRIERPSVSELRKCCIASKAMQAFELDFPRATLLPRAICARGSPGWSNGFLIDEGVAAQF